MEARELLDRRDQRLLRVATSVMPCMFAGRHHLQVPWIHTQLLSTPMMNNVSLLKNPALQDERHPMCQFIRSLPRPTLKHELPISVGDLRALPNPALVL